jgi:DNA gyrase subunit A
MRFREDDALLSMDVVREGSFVVTVTDGGYAKRTPVEEWSPKGRGILGVRAMRLVEARGGLVGAVVCTVDDQIFAVANDGIVIRTRVDEIRPSGRDTMGVRLMNLGEDRSLVAVARAGESEDESDEDDAADSPPGDESASTGGDSDASASGSADATTGQDTSDGLPQV